MLTKVRIAFATSEQGQTMKKKKTRSHPVGKSHPWKPEGDIEMMNEMGLPPRQHVLAPIGASSGQNYMPSVKRKAKAAEGHEVVQEYVSPPRAR